MSHDNSTTPQTSGSNLDGQSAPRHWIGVEELDPSYWQNPLVKEKRSQEFHDKPIETIDLIDKFDKGGLHRREFMTVMGASMAMAGFACARRPVEKIIPYVVQPEEIIPGVANWYASTFTDGGQSYGVLVKNRDGRPIKIEGNPDHPLNRGALHAIGQASLLSLYDPERLQKPIFRDRATGGAAESTWEQVDAQVVQKLKAAGGKIRILTGETKSPTSTRLFKEFLASVGGGSVVEFEPISYESIVEAQAQSYGTSVIPKYRFDKAEVILSLGADFLGTWHSPVEYSAGWSKNRKLIGKALSKLFVFESMMTVTGANADDRYPIRPGDELKVALAVASELVKGTKYAGDMAAQGLLVGYTAEAVAAEVGLPGGAGTIRKVAKALWAARGKSLIVAGGLSSQVGSSVSLQIAVNFLNSLLENDGATVEGDTQVAFQRARLADLLKLIDEMKSGAVDVLVIHRSNPLFTLPPELGFAEALKRVGTVILSSDRDDETGQASNFVLPDHHYLEAWGDAEPRKGILSLQQPVIAPITGSRAFEDTLLSWVKGVGGSPKAPNFHEYLKLSWKEVVFKDYKGPATFEQFWEGCLRKGVFESSSTQALQSRARAFKTSALGAVPRNKITPTGLKLALFTNVSQSDGRYANNAWLQELPDPVTSVTWDNYIAMSPALAKQLGVVMSDVVEMTQGNRSAKLPVFVQPGMHPAVVAVPAGYGRRNVGKVGKGNGVDVVPFMGVQAGEWVTSGQTVSLKKIDRVYKLAATQYHFASENRPIINDITLTDYLKDPAAENDHSAELRMHALPTMWSKHEYKGHRWGMSIDLNSCTGCGSCVIACQAENNIPVVGREQVRVSRQMHWIRIDRYYSGAADHPDVLFQPMLCQHCENAPCETVCPVLATVHDDEGLNSQIYNRCVGTRYCQNNCPYKVRRFNFFDHWKSYEGALNMVWNPDVTVRTRGIMEKCTFCVQRVRSAKDRAKDMGEKLKDGAFKTACQQTCPTEAIVFGDINSQQSEVSLAKRDLRTFHSLESLNVKPVVSYLTKVRNKEGSRAVFHKNKESQGHGAGSQH